MDDMKKCPKCGQMVKSVAKKCRYCGYWFEEGAASPQPSVAPQPQQRVISIGEVLTEGVTLGIANFVANNVAKYPGNISGSVFTTANIVIVLPAAFILLPLI